MKFYQVSIPVLTRTYEVHIIQANSEENAINKILEQDPEPSSWTDDPDYYVIQKHLAEAEELEVLE